MAGRSDVQNHLAQRRFGIAESFEAWADPACSDEGRTDILDNHFTVAKLGEVRRIGNNSVFCNAGSSGNYKTVLVVGRHDLDGLSMGADALVDDSNVLQGPAAGSRFGPTIAFAEGVLAASTASNDEPMNVSFLSLGAGDTFAQVASALFLGHIDAVVMTNAVAWSNDHTAITTGARGQLVAELTLTAGQSPNDFVSSGAFRNPLSKLTQILGALRDDRGRIALPGFYSRAQRPDEERRQSFAEHGDLASSWAANMGTVRPAGDLSSLERASLWPGVSVLACGGDQTDGFAMPGSASATIGFYLIPDQRHAEVESALREWFLEQAPPDLNPTIKLISSSRPYRSPSDSVLVTSQTRAARALGARKTLLVPGGGPSGAGEMAYALGAPVAFAGLISPENGFGTTSESLPRHRFESGIAMAAETVLQLRKA